MTDCSSESFPCKAFRNVSIRSYDLASQAPFTSWTLARLAGVGRTGGGGGGSELHRYLLEFEGEVKET